MKRYCLAVDLKDNPELIREYEHLHEEVWPEILESIRSAGILDMQIYRTGNRLFMIMETADNFSMDAKAAADKNNPAVQHWEDLMWTFQQPLPWAAPGEKWILMDNIFQL
ncbi:L-rhamnose mutarotase [Dinghuibacter silviterrae]|uniref:L-rhamnose mutarotase n=1 Tax=Dinghuibacter silviterrae TaxID=1539049 RepID=A0A4R8DJ76_9BACT|nr:L-rhamnose mutarotase [Dinghuibacter silviterrae]TDW97617.1 L-rhamnose mutarotase [Dinghuibacter silviterrae]